VIMSDQEYLTPRDLPDYLREEFTNLVKKGLKAKKSLDEIKDEYISEILKETGGSKKAAADILRVNPRTLYRFEKKAHTKPKA
jgi:transcriptional regulator with PAS, ATPase and Fis domain